MHLDTISNNRVNGEELKHKNDFINSKMAANDVEIPLRDGIFCSSGSIDGLIGKS